MKAQGGARDGKESTGTHRLARIAGWQGITGGILAGDDRTTLCGRWRMIGAAMLDRLLRMWEAATRGCCRPPTSISTTRRCPSWKRR